MKTKISKMLFVLGWIVIIVGIIESFILGDTFKDIQSAYLAVYNWSVVIGGIFASILLGAILIGFSELIQSQQENAKLLREMNAQVYYIRVCLENRERDQLLGSKTKNDSQK